MRHFLRSSKRLTPFRTRRAAIFFAGFFLCIPFAPQASARSILLGSETAAMGGTGVAFGRDAAMPLLNPAGLAQLGGTRLTFSGSFYVLKHRRIPRFFAEDHDVKSKLGHVTLDTLSESDTSVYATPTAAAISLGFGPGAGKHGHMVLALSLLVPNKNVGFLEAAASATGPGIYSNASFTYSHENTDLFVGASYGIQLGRRLRLGASAFLTYGSIANSFSANHITQATGIYTALDSQAAGSGYSVDILAVVGAQLDITPSVALGLSVTSPSLHLGGSYSGHGETRAFGSLAATTSVRTSVSDGEATIHRPLALSLGLSYHRARVFALAADFTLRVNRKLLNRLETSDVDTTYLPNKDPQVTESTTVSGDKGILSYRINVGGELWLSKAWVLRSGFFFEPPDQKDFEEPLDLGDFLTYRFTRLGGTLGLGSAGSVVATSYGLGFAYSTGSVGVQTYLDPQGGMRKTDANSFEVFAFVAGGFDLKTVTDALKK